MWISSWQIHHGPDLCPSASFEKLYEYAKEVYTCFVGLEKAYDHVPRGRLWAILLECDMRDQLLALIKLLYKQSEVCVYVNGTETKFGAGIQGVSKVTKL